MDKLIEKVIIEGAEFEIIKKNATIYAGYKAEADNENVNTFELFQKGQEQIKGSLTADCMLCISINFKECNHGKDAQRYLMHCQETSERNQPDGIEVVESPECLIIRAKSTEATWALVKKVTGEDNPQWHMAPLFGLCEKLFCNEEKGYALTPDFSNTYEIEYYYSNGVNYAGISVIRL